MTKKKNENKVILTCIILLLICAGIFTAVAFGAGRRARPEVKDEGTGEETLSYEVRTEPETERVTEDTSAVTRKPVSVDEPEESAAASVNIEDIVFTVPCDGGVIVSCSLTVPVYSLTMNDYRTHMGVDIASPTGSAVKACASGEVVSVFEDPMMGMTVTLRHGEGIESVYKNLSLELPDGIAVGASVTGGQVIGAVGDTALIECEEESHVHFELKVNGEAVDPGEYMELVSINEIYED